MLLLLLLLLLLFTVCTHTVDIWFYTQTNQQTNTHAHTEQSATETDRPTEREWAHSCTRTQTVGCINFIFFTVCTAAHTLSLVILPHKIYDIHIRRCLCVCSCVRVCIMEYLCVCMYTKCFVFEYTENDGRATHRKKNLNRFFFSLTFCSVSSFPWLQMFSFFYLFINFRPSYFLYFSEWWWCRSILIFIYMIGNSFIFLFHLEHCNKSDNCRRIS